MEVAQGADLAARGAGRGGSSVPRTIRRRSAVM